MFIHLSNQPKNISFNLLERFVKSCHWDYFKKYDLVGHHDAGWGFAYIPKNSKKLLLKRTLYPIYSCKWQDLTKIKTKFLLVHARKTIFGEKTTENVHPINIRGEYSIAHNGTIRMDSFQDLDDSLLQEIQKNSDLDTRRYLCTILDNLNKLRNVKEAIEMTLRNIEVNSAANAFLFNLDECYIIKYQKNTFNGRHTTLFFDKTSDGLTICTTPLSSTAQEIPNKSLITIKELGSRHINIEFDRLKV